MAEHSRKFFEHPEFDLNKFYRVDTGYTAFKILDIDPLRQVAEVEYYPRGSIAIWPLDRIVDLHSTDYHPCRCPGCGQANPEFKTGKSRDKLICRNCGWSTADIKTPEDYDHEKGQTNMANNLYRVVDSEPELFCTKLTTDSRGRWVVEMKGTGEVKTFEPAKLEEVMPYTVGVVFITPGSHGKTYHYFAVAGQFAKGDLLLDENANYVKVTGINTRSRTATKHFTGWKIAANRIPDPVDDAINVSDD